MSVFKNYQGRNYFPLKSTNFHGFQGPLGTWNVNSSWPQPLPSQKKGITIFNDATLKPAGDVYDRWLIFTNWARNYSLTLESKPSSAFTACPFCTKMSTTLVFFVSVLMSTCTRLMPCWMEYSDTRSERSFTSVMKQLRAWLLHWLPRMMDWAEGRSPATWNSLAWNHKQRFVSETDKCALFLWQMVSGIATWNG